VALPGAGALAHGVALAQLNPAGLAPILSLLALFLIVLQLCCELLLRATAVALFTAPLAAGLVGLALLLGLAPGVEASAGRNVWSVLHVTLSVLAIALLALAFVSAALYLLQFRELKTKRFGQVFQLFPPLERLDRLNYGALAIAFPALTVGLLFGVGVRFAAGVAGGRGGGAGAAGVGIVHLGGAGLGGVGPGGAGVGGSARGVREHRRLRGGRPGLLGAEARRAGKGTLPLNTMGA